MVAFTPIVQADFSGTAFGGVPTWTDITRFARLKVSPVTINKWRQDELKDVAPTTMTLVLDNADLPGDATAPNAGRFTPFLSTSPWSPRILPGVRLRVGVTVGVTTYWRFDGYAENWEAGLDAGDFPICTVTATDILGRLGAMDPLRAIYTEEVLADAPIAFYPLTESSSSLDAADIAGSNAPLLYPFTGSGGSLTFATATGIPSDGASNVTLNAVLTTAASDDALGSYLATRDMVAFPNNYPTSIASTLEVVLTLNPSIVPALARQGGGSVTVLTLSGPQFNLIAMRLRYDGSSAVQLLLSGAGVGPDLNDGRLHHLALTYASSGTMFAYVDGVQVGSTAAIGLSPAPASTARGRVLVGGTAGNDSFRGGIGYAAIYPTQLSGARIAAHNTAARTGFAGEGTSTHVARLLTYRANLGSTLDAGQGSVGLHQTAGQTPAQALLATAKAEGGVLYADPATGKIVLLDRTRLRNPASVLTLDVTAQQTGPDLSVRADTQQLVNDATISRVGGATARSADAASKSTYGARGVTDSLIVAVDADAANAAGWVVGNQKAVRARIPPLSVDLLTEPSATVAAAVLGLVPMQRVTLANPPPSLPSPDVVIQGCTDTIGVDVFTCSFFTGPLPRPTLRFDAAASSATKLDTGNVFAW